MSSSGASLELTGLSKSRAGRAILRALDLRVASGTFVSILGPSGVGKSTILELIAGFLPADEGTISIDGLDVTHLPANRRGIGFIFQDFALFPHLSVAQNVRFALDAAGVARGEANARTAEALHMVGLTGLEARAPGQLSGGQRQRVAIARALVSRPSLLLMDEPVSSLDAGLREETMREIRRLQRTANVTVICVTHDLGEALSISDHIAVLGRGHIVQIGTPQQIHHTPVSPYVARLAGPLNVAPLTPGESHPVTLAVAPSLSASAASGELLGVRPYDISLRHSRSSDADVLAVQGVVVEAKLSGHGYAYDVDIAGAAWRVISSRSFAGVEVGTRVWLEWPRSSMLLMRADSAG
jgi:putative spermidine/putrescine transport system ATP-binding protein